MPQSSQGEANKAVAQARRNSGGTYPAVAGKSCSRRGSRQQQRLQRRRQERQQQAGATAANTMEHHGGRQRRPQHQSAVPPQGPSRRSNAGESSSNGPASSGSGSGGHRNSANSGGSGHFGGSNNSGGNTKNNNNSNHSTNNNHNNNSNSNNNSGQRSSSRRSRSARRGGKRTATQQEDFAAEEGHSGAKKNRQEDIRDKTYRGAQDSATKAHGKTDNTTMEGIEKNDDQDKDDKPRSKSKAHLSEQTFASLDILPQTKKALAEVLKFTHLTKVQAATLPEVMKGGDVLAKAKTGSGKTVGFMLPTIENIAKKKQAPSPAIQCVVIAPTRDLAIQVYEEAKALATYHSHVSMACIVGGINKNKDLRRFDSNIDILIATPGRLQDHLATTSGFADRMRSLEVLILDEADRLLDMGFRPDIERILGYLPKSRQTLLFSATYPTSLEPIVKFALKEDFKLIDTIGEESTQTNAQVTQKSTIVSQEMHPHVLYWLLHDHMEQMSKTPEGYKVMVFFPTARIVGFWAQIFNHIGVRVLEMHSRKSQAQRGKLVTEFRSGKNLIMFSSDVSARGLDFEGVTLILQMGLTDREQYIHRLGRTARAGQGGQGILVLAPFERKFLNELKDLPVEAIDGEALEARGQAAPVTKALQDVERDVNLFLAAESAYRTFLGFYINKTKALGKSRSELIQQANTWSADAGLTRVPELEAKTAGKMGLKGSTEVNIHGKRFYNTPDTRPIAATAAQGSSNGPSGQHQGGGASRMSSSSSGNRGGRRGGHGGGARSGGGNQGFRGGRGGRGNSGRFSN